MGLAFERDEKRHSTKNVTIANSDRSRRKQPSPAKNVQASAV
jgi:hypothetical protein